MNIFKPKGKLFDDLPEVYVFIENLTMKEFCGLVDKSVKTISRKIAEGKIHPRIIKSKQGTKEYRFSEDNVKAFFWDELPLEIKANR
jgi:hypothetical protein